MPRPITLSPGCDLRALLALLVASIESNLTGLPPSAPRLLDCVIQHNAGSQYCGADVHAPPRQRRSCEGGTRPALPLALLGAWRGRRILTASHCLKRHFSFFVRSTAWRVTDDTDVCRNPAPLVSHFLAPRGQDSETHRAPRAAAVLGLGRGQSTYTHDP